MAVTAAEIAVIVGITGRFEASGDPYEGVSGNFDGQGISCGVLQWNIGQASLPPLVLRMGDAAVPALMPEFGADLLKACRSPIGKGLAIVNAWQTNNRLKAAPARELKALMGSPAMRRIQDAAIAAVARGAETLADKWAADRGGGGRTPQELAWFFDTLTQNGSIAGLDHAAVKAFITAATPGSVDDLVCDWLASRPTTVAGAKDGFANAKLWRNAVKDRDLALFVLSYLRSQKAKVAWRVDVLNRKATIAFRKGRVHQTDIDLTDVIP